jgi:GDP/GTP exchange factor required for growth at low temperature
VFDVLQTYRGLPLLDKLSPGSTETTVIKMSLSADDSAAPRDDPRFVIWGEFNPERERDDISISQGSLTDLSSSTHSSNTSRKKSFRNTYSDPPSLYLSTGQETQKVVVAATVERWIAQLTSELNYDEMLNFFLTYRTYITALDLCHLLICRFHWALEQRSSSHDEMVRRIVRVRTFVAIRYWLLTFFVVDFLPNRELRLLVADWLNTLLRDPILEEHKDGLVSLASSIVYIFLSVTLLSAEHCAQIEKGCKGLQAGAYAGLSQN